MAGDFSAEAQDTTTNPIRRPRSGHGALREDDTQRSLRSPLLVESISEATARSVTSSGVSRLSESRLNAPDRSPSAIQLLFGRRRDYANVRQLRGKISRVPRFWLWSRFLNNSFFARRLMRSGVVVSLALTAGVTVYNIEIRDWLVHYKASHPDDFQKCEEVAVFSGLIYHMMPVVILLTLPGSGLRTFEPFKREISGAAVADRPTELEDGGQSGSTATIKRRFVFQLCEVLAVLALLYDAVLVVFFLRVLFTGAIYYACGSYYMHLFLLGGVTCYSGILVVLYYFTRYREHIKMQLGAFSESDQTGDIRKHATDLDNNRRSNMPDKMLEVVRVRLYYATRRGDLQEMREILNYANARGFTSSEFGFPRKTYAAPRLKFKFFATSRRNPVHVAAYYGNIRALELLEEYGFDLTVPDKFHRVTVSTGRLLWYFVRFFVKRPSGGAEDADTAISVFQSTLTTPVHCAVSTGQLETVRWLLERGASPRTLATSSSRSSRVPPLFLAEHAEIARELLVHGADPLAIPDPGSMNTMTPFQLACVRGNYAVAQELEEWGSDVALTPFHLAAAQNDVVAVRKFISRKTDVDCLGEMGYVGLNRRTPLHWAAISGSTEAVDALLKAGADPNFQDARGRSPLHWAARLNKLEVVRSLLRGGAEPNLADGEFMTPLMCAASALDASRELFDELTSAGGDIGYQLPTTGDTALHVAVRQENEASALAALSCGGDLMRMNGEGLRPLDCTASTRLLFELKRAAGQRDVMISYTHSHLEFARKLRQSLEDANVTTWLDLMDPSGIGGGAVWREEIARGITNASVVVCILTEDYADSDWCLKELALAKQVGTPILAVSTEGAIVNEHLQVYLYTRQIVPFEPAITTLKFDEGRIEYEYDEGRYRSQFHLLLDGVRDEVEKSRYASKEKNVASNRRSDRDLENGSSGLGTRGTTLETLADTQLSEIGGPWNPSGSSPIGLQDQPFVFLSHGDRHVEFVRQLSSQLSTEGVACYVDRNVAGQGFDTRIQVSQEAILHCSCFVVLVSRQTAGNELVRDQLAFAEDKGRSIFPVVLNDLEPGLDKRYTLVRSELFHFMANGMNFSSSFARLAGSLRLHCSVESQDGAGTSATGSDTEQTRNLDSIEGLEDNQLHLSSTLIRM